MNKQEHMQAANRRNLEPRSIHCALWGSQNLKGAYFSVKSWMHKITLCVERERRKNKKWRLHYRHRYNHSFSGVTTQIGRSQPVTCDLGKRSLLLQAFGQPIEGTKNSYNGTRLVDWATPADLTIVFWVHGNYTEIWCEAHWKPICRALLYIPVFSFVSRNRFNRLRFTQDISANGSSHLILSQSIFVFTGCTQETTQWLVLPTLATWVVVVVSLLEFISSPSPGH